MKPEPFVPQGVTLSRKKDYRMPPRTKKVARPTRWGNPFYVNPDLAGAKHHPMACATNEEAVEKYEREVMACAPLVAEIRKWLRGFNLACFCKQGEACHREILLRIANE